MQFRLYTTIVGLLLLLGFSSCQKSISGNGVVIDKATGLPMKGVSIIVYLEHPSPDTFQMQTTTDAKGDYFVSSIPQACTGNCPSLYVEIIKEGYVSQYVKDPHNDTTCLVRSGSTPHNANAFQP